MLSYDELKQFHSFKGGIHEFMRHLWEKNRTENAVKDLLDIEEK